MSRPDDCAAFPIVIDGQPGTYLAEPGMSLRDYFAAKALPGVLYMVAHGIYEGFKGNNGCAAEPTH